jgi:rhomboid protease GluP
VATSNKEKKAYFTYLLILLNLIFFALENLKGGSQDIETLYQLGGLVPDAVWEGEWWRLINANFLHFGWLHLLNNMIALYFIGRLVEYHLGIIRYFIVYSLSGIGSMFIYSIMGSANTILVGASGAIMGLVGLTISLILRIWRKYKSSIACQNLLLLLFLILLQFIFDLANPQISWLIHLLGLVIGFLLGMLLNRWA